MGRKNEDGIPKMSPRPLVEILGASGGDAGPYVLRAEFKCMFNGGYIFYARLADPYFNILHKFIDDGDKTYLHMVRRKPLNVKVKFSWKGDDDTLKTDQISANIVAMQSSGGNEQGGYTEFVAIDEPSWLLGNGDASGKVYEGSVREVMDQIASDYQVSIDFQGKTKDYKHGKWCMMRQDPKTFMMSLLDWSTPLSKDKTQWAVYSGHDGTITIQEIASVQPQKRSTYKKRGVNDQKKQEPISGDISNWDVFSDGAMSLVQHKLVTHGISAVSGMYLDKVTDEDEEKVFVKDDTTEKKWKPKTFPYNAPTEKDDSEKTGYTSVRAIPELSGGEMGLKYDEYIDGYARDQYFKLNNMILRCRIRVAGHHIWDTGEGLGADTVFLDWKDVDGEPYNLDGSWTVYGFHHLMDRKMWWTDLYLFRIDHDAKAQVSGGGN